MRDLSRPLAVMTAGVIPGAGLGLIAAMFSTTDVDRGRLYFRLLIGVVAVGMIAFAANRFLYKAERSRRPRWQRTWAVAELLLAVYALVLALKGW